MLFVFVVFEMQAQRIKAIARIDSTDVLIGDQMNIELELEKPKDIRVDFPEIGGTLSEYVEIIRKSGIDTAVLEDNKQKLLQKLVVTSFDSGAHRIPPFRFKMYYDGRIDSIESNDLIIKVYTMPIDTTRGPTDIKMPYAAPVTLKEILPWIFAIILVAASVFLIVYYINRKKQNKPLFSFPAKPKVPAHIVALRELDRIKDEKIWQKDKIKEFYSQITDVVRTYIEGRFGIPAMEQTSEEIFDSFAGNPALVSDKAIENLQQMLPLADLVKFAKYQPLPDDHNLMLINAYFFINDTKPIEVNKVEKQQKSNDEEGQEVTLK
ncbi:MAG: hypothetical protein FWG22_04935 [Prolixibacteraceae bacterium]|nr:hypothetical protein [Prolixibacteraceae bacterium]